MTTAPGSRGSQPYFTEPTRFGYLYLGFRVAPPRRAPFVRPDGERRRVLEACERRARRLESLSEVVAATVYEAVLIPPVQGSPKFDAMVLVQTSSPESASEVESAEAYREMAPDFSMAARNVRRIGDVDRVRSGAFLFNHFTSADPSAALRVWEEVTEWFVEQAGVEDSALLQPVRESPYALVNHVRLPTGPVRFMLNFAKPSFRTAVAAKLRAEGIGNAPVICRPR